MQQFELGNSDLGETNFVAKMVTRATPLRDKILRTSGIHFFHEFRGETSQYKEAGKTPISKTQQVFHVKSVFDELELIMRISTSYKTPYG